MLKTRLLPIATCCLGLALLISSLDWSSESSEKSEVAEVDVELATAADDAPASFLDEPSVPVVAEVSPQVAPSGPQVGERYSFQKTVEQRITQSRPDAPATGNSRLSIGLSLQVADVVGSDNLTEAPLGRQSGDKLISVQYRNVKFVQDIPGQEVNYDSNDPQGAVPPQAEAYRGLPGQGFSFWLDRRNQLRGLVGFPDFLEKCLQHASPQQRTIVWQSLAGMSEGDQLANFVHDGIGILTVDDVRPGATWQRERNVQQPVPITMQLQYTIEESSRAAIDVAIGGTIVPQPARNVGGAQLEILGGRIFGRCTIDPRTGLPHNSRVEQALEMVVQLPDGTRIPQTKQTITQFTALPDSAAPQERIPYAGVEKSSRLR